METAPKPPLDNPEDMLKKPSLRAWITALSLGAAVAISAQELGPNNQMFGSHAYLAHHKMPTNGQAGNG